MNHLQRLHQLSAVTTDLVQFGFGSTVEEVLGKARGLAGSASKRIGPWGTSIAKDAGMGALKVGALGAGVGAIGGGISGGLSSDPNRTALGGAVRGAVKGGTIGALAGGALGAASTAASPAISRWSASAIRSNPSAFAGEKGAQVSMMGSEMNDMIRKRGYTGNLGQFSSRLDRLIQLRAKTDAVINFDSLANNKEFPGGIPRRLGGVLAAKKGEKLNATKAMYSDAITHAAKHLGIGAAVGATAGIAGGIATAAHGRNLGRVMRSGRALKYAAIGGAGLGGAVGFLGGSVSDAVTGPKITDRKYDKYFDRR